MINSDVMKAVQQARPFKAFVNELAVGYVSEKHKLQLDPKYKLPKMTYKGTEIRPQRVKMDPKPLVSDITSTRDSDEPSFPLLPSKAAAKKAKAAAAAGAAAAPSSSSKAAASSAGATVQGAAAGSNSSWHHEVKCEGRPVTHMVVSVQLPAPSTSSSTWSPDAVSVQLCGTQLRVMVDHKQQQQHQQQQRQEGASQQQPSQQQQQQQQQGPSSVCIQLPFAANHAGAEAQLQSSSGQLVVQLPYLPVQQWVQQLQQEAPTAFSKLPVSHEAYMELDD